GIARMTDRPQTSGYNNLSINLLPELISDLALKGEIQELCVKALDSAKFAREHRDKRIAHHDYGYAADPRPLVLSQIDIESVEQILEALRDTLGFVAKHYLNTTLLFERFGAHSGARVLIGKLKRLETA